MPVVRVAGIAFILALAAGPLFPQTPDEEPEVQRFIVPVVGHVIGRDDVQWRSNVTLYNPTREEIFVGLTLVSTGQPAAFSVEPGQWIVLQDVVGGLFGVTDLLSSLEVASLGPLSVSSVAWGALQERTTSPIPSPLFAQELPPGVWVLDGLVNNEQRRTNVGLGNLLDVPISIRIALQRISGRNLAVVDVPLPPRSLIHAPIDHWFEGMSDGDSFRIVLDSISPGFLAYACVLDNDTHSGRMIVPVGAAAP